MQDANKDLLDGLRKAMEAERTGHVFYLTAAQQTTDPTAREVFEDLAREEREHYEFLAVHYRSILEKGKIAEGVRVPRPAALEDSPIFSDNLRKRLGGAHFEMSALSIAIQLELNAVNHYREQAAKAKIPEVRAFYEQLAQWERSHYEAFLRQQQSLQEDYWNEARFQPF